jgi:hypothetical protein
MAAALFHSRTQRVLLLRKFSHQTIVQGSIREQLRQSRNPPKGHRGFGLK